MGARAHGFLGGRPPAVELAREQALAAVLVDAAAAGLLDSAHDLAEGGLAQALVESCLRGGRGAQLALPDGADPFVALFSESTAARGGRRCAALRSRRCGSCAHAYGVPATRLGVVAAAGAPLDVAGLFRIPLGELRAAWTADAARPVRD